MVLKFILLLLSIFGFGFYVNQMLIMILRIVIYKEDYDKKIGISVLLSLLIASICTALFLTLY